MYVCVCYGTVGCHSMIAASSSNCHGVYWHLFLEITFPRLKVMRSFGFRILSVCITSSSTCHNQGHGHFDILKVTPRLCSSIELSVRQKEVHLLSYGILWYGLSHIPLTVRTDEVCKVELQVSLTGTSKAQLLDRVTAYYLFPFSARLFLWVICMAS